LTDPHRQIHLQLGDLTVHLVITDEQAKIHVPSLVSRRGRGEAETLIRRALREVRSSPIAQADVDVALRPYEAPRLEAFALPAFGSYGQVFADLRPEDLIVLTDDHDTATASWEPARGPAALVTCWGDGRVNLRRASAAVLEAVCEPLIGPAEINQLLVLRDQHADQPAADLKPLLEQFEVSAATRAKLAELLTMQSRCYGLWVIIEDDRRTWRHFAVGASNESSKTSALGGMMQTFSW
jgi:type II secretory pathway component PulK